DKPADFAAFQCWFVLCARSVLAINFRTGSFGGYGMPDDRDWMNALFTKPPHHSLASAPPAANWLEALARPAPPPRSLQPTTLGGLLAPTQKRMVYFAFAFDDQMRVNNIRQFGKIGPRESRNARHFRDRSIWESRDIKTVEGLKDLMRDAMK